MVDIGDFRGRFRSNVAELELTDAAGQDLVTGCNCFLHCVPPGIVPAMAEHCGRNALACISQVEVWGAVTRVALQNLPDQLAQPAQCVNG